MLTIAQVTISMTAKRFLVTIFMRHAKNSWTQAEMIPLYKSVRSKSEVEAEVATTYGHGGLGGKD
jgi:hypothetical protein